MTVLAANRYVRVRYRMHAANRQFAVAMKSAIVRDLSILKGGPASDLVTGDALDRA